MDKAGMALGCAVSPGGLVHIVEPDEVMRRHLVGLAAAEGLTVRAYGDVAAFFAVGRDDTASCLVIDVRLTGASGVPSPERAGRVECSVVVTAKPADFALTVRAIRAGAANVLEKPFEDEEAIATIQAALRLDRERRLGAERLTRLRSLFETLSPRERQVMALVAAGRLNNQVGGDLGLSEITVKAHRGAVMRKMKAGSLADLVRMSDVLATPA